MRDDARGTRRELQVNQHGLAYARPYVRVGAVSGVDEAVFETLTAPPLGE